MNRLQEINKELKELWSDESWIKLGGREGNVKLHEDLSILNVDKHHQMIHHPLLIATFNGNDFLTTQANLHYESKCIQVKNALKDKDINMSFCMKDHTGLMLYTKRMMNGGCLMTKSIGRWLVGCGLIQKTFMNINIYGKIY